MPEMGSDGILRMGGDMAQGASVGTGISPGMGTAIGAGLGLLGGITGSFFNRDLSERQMAFAREMAQNGIQWRVEDARKAGIHPLYALGAPTFNAPNIMIEDPLPQAMRESGQQIGHAIGQMQSQSDKLITALQLDMLQSQARKLKAEAGIVEEQELASYNARNSQNGLGIHSESDRVNEMGQVPQVRGTEVPGAAESGWYDVQPSKYTSASVAAPGLEARGREGQQEWRIRPDFYLIMPYSDEGYGEQWHEMSMREKLTVLKQNANIYGQHYFQDAVNFFFFGKEPEHKYKSATSQGWKPNKPSGQRGKEMWRRIFPQK